MNYNRRKFFRCVIICAVCFFSLSHLYAGDSPSEKNAGRSLKVLTIGNSFADNAVTFLPQIAASVAGYEIAVTKANLGGCSLERHVNLIQACEEDPENKPYSKKYCLKDLLLMDDYDYVTIQQLSSLSFKPASLQPYADELIRFIRENEPQAEIIIQQTWAYPNPDRLEEWGITYDEMHAGLVESYNLLAGKHNIRIMPVGKAFFNTHKKNSKIDLWNNDRHHANVNGCYLAGCVWFGIMADVFPKKVEFIPQGMDQKTAKFLRKMAAREIKRQDN
jgi:hypothetical protein